MELDRRHLHGPDHAPELSDAQLVGGPSEPREVNVHRLDPVGRAPGQPLLVHLLAVDAVRESMEHAWTLAQRADDPVADAHVVPSEVELGLAARREIHAVGIRDPYGPAADVQLDGLA